MLSPPRLIQYHRLGLRAGSESTTANLSQCIERPSPSFRTEQADAFSSRLAPAWRSACGCEESLFALLSALHRPSRQICLSALRAPRRHSERSKPTLFPPASLLRGGRLADVRNLSSPYSQPCIAYHGKSASAHCAPLNVIPNGASRRFFLPPRSCVAV